jgi:hypothetical protein
MAVGILSVQGRSREEDVKNEANCSRRQIGGLHSTWASLSQLNPGSGPAIHRPQIGFVHRSRALRSMVRSFLGMLSIALAFRYRLRYSAPGPVRQSEAFV